MWSFKTKAHQTFQYETYYIWFWIQFKRKCPVISGSLNFNPEVKWAWNNRAFSFKSIPKSYVICLILECLVGFYFETPRQNVLKLIAWPHGVMNYNPEVKWGWNNRAFSFKSNPRSYVICLILECLVGFYFETPHQNVLKLLGWPCGVLNYNPEVKWAWNNRAFSFRSNPKSYVICLIFGGLLFWNYASECPETSWVTLWGLELSPCSEPGITGHFLLNRIQNHM